MDYWTGHILRHNGHLLLTVLEVDKDEENTSR